MVLTDPKTKIERLQNNVTNLQRELEVAQERLKAAQHYHAPTLPPNQGRNWLKAVKNIKCVLCCNSVTGANQCCKQTASCQSH